MSRAEEVLAKVLHRAFHEAWSGPKQELDLYADSPIWRAQAAALDAVLTAQEGEPRCEHGTSLSDLCTWVENHAEAALTAQEGEQDWPCDDYKPPLTCWTTPKPKTLTCEGCRAAFPTGAEIRALYKEGEQDDRLAAVDYDKIAEQIDDAMRRHAESHRSSNSPRDFYCGPVCVSEQLQIVVRRVLTAALADPAPTLARVRAEAKAEHREEWASYFESRLSAIGPEPLTVEGVIAALRWEQVPFGVSQATP